MRDDKHNLNQIRPDKSVLLIAHEFPPINGGHVMRALKFSKYLPEYGWQPIILTAKPDDCYFSSAWGRDPELLQEITGWVNIHQVPSPLERHLRRLRQRLAASRQRRSTVQATNVALCSSGSISHSRKLQRFFKPSRQLHAFQDQSNLWLPFACRAALQLARSKQIDAVLTTSPPHWTHLVGYWLKRRTGLPWIADFRDGWIDNPLFEAESPLRQRFDRVLEQLVVAHADLKLAVTKHMLDSFHRRYPSHADTFHLIRNGFDPADFRTSASARASPTISFVHMGNLGGSRNAAPLLEGFQQLFAEGRLPANDVVIQFVGKVHTNGTALPPFAQLQLIPPVGHHEAIIRMQQASVLILITATQEGSAAFTSKVFEYLAAGRPILALIPPIGELAALLSSYPKGIVVEPDNVEHIKTAIVQAYRIATDADQPAIDDTLLSQFDRRRQTEQLAKLLTSLITQRS